MKKHTPGPWKISQKYEGDEGIQYPKGSFRIAQDTKDAYGTATVQCVFGEANARLIAAAPELLEELKFWFGRGVDVDPSSLTKEARDELLARAERTMKILKNADWSDE